MAMTLGPINAVIKIRVDFSLWGAIKLRIAGIKTGAPKITIQGLIDKDYSAISSGATAQG